MKIFSEKNIGKLIILNSSLVGLLMWLGIVAHTFWDSEINLKMELAQLEKEHIRDKKKSVSQSVQDFIYSMDMRHQAAVAMLQHSLRNQVRQIHSMASSIYEQNKNKMERAELEQLIIEAIRPFKLNNERSYFFIRSMSGMTKLWPPNPQLEGTSIYNNSNENRLKVFNSMVKVARKGEGFNEYLWSKSTGDTEKIHQKIAYVTYFSPFDWYIGAGDYLDEIERDTQKDVTKVIQQHAGRTVDEYMFILDLHSMKGEENFATMLINPNRPDPLNTLLSNDYQEPTGRQFRAEFLAGLSEYGEVFVKYLDKKAGTNEVRPKMTYFKLYPKWHWIIARGFYYDDLQAQI
ncbi:MAG: hypothetical protein D3923_10175, partial [Candidatus Electrothrix sp. AR3]|nr:hypothetical protein [Candidatus Electrothrix sp. AR3]